MACNASQIAEFLGLQLYGSNIEIDKPCSVNNISSNSVMFVKKFNHDLVELLNSYNDILVLAPDESDNELHCPYILTPNPRLSFAKVLQNFFSPKAVTGISPTAVIGDNVIMGINVSIGHYSVIGSNVTIRDNTEIRHNVVISDNTVIGKNCLIKSNTVIGEEGFGFERDEDGVPVRIPHLGKVEIGDNVEIGASVVIAKGTLDNTVVEKNAKIDDQVFIAHNVRIGENSMVIANSEISGSTKIGANCWIGPNSSIINGITIGDNVFIGLGAVVIKSVDSGLTVAGNPAKELRKKIQ